MNILNVYALVASCSERGNTYFLVVDVALSWFEGVFLYLFVNIKCRSRKKFRPPRNTEFLQLRIKVC